MYNKHYCIAVDISKREKLKDILVFFKMRHCFKNTLNVNLAQLC